MAPLLSPPKNQPTWTQSTFTTSPTQLPTEQVWKDLIYAHYSLYSSTPILAVRAELGAFPTYIPGICRVSNYLAYLCDPTCPPLVAKEVIVQKTLAQPTNSHGGTMLGAYPNHTISQNPQYPPTSHNSKLTSKASTVGGGSNTSLHHPIVLNLIHSASSTSPSIVPHT